MRVRVEGSHGDRDEDRQDAERDREVEPLRGVAERSRDLALQAPPHDRLDQLVAGEDEGESGQGQLGRGTDVPERVEPDRADHQPCGEVDLRGEAHGGRPFVDGCLRGRCGVGEPPGACLLVAHTSCVGCRRDQSRAIGIFLGAGATAGLGAGTRTSRIPSLYDAVTSASVAPSGSRTLRDTRP